MRVPGVRFVQGRNAHGTSTKYGIAVHATANDAPAAGEASYAQRRTDGIGAHFYVDDTEVIQSLDTGSYTWHAGNQGNTLAIAVEITGVNSWSRSKWLASVAWEALGAVLAAVGKAHDIPARRLTVAQMQANQHTRGAYDHNQMRLAWGGTDHTDPGPNFPWDHLLAVWKRHLNGEDDDMPITDADAGKIAARTWDSPVGRGDNRKSIATAVVEGRNASVSGFDELQRQALTQEAILAKVTADDKEAADIKAHVDRVAAALPKPPTAEETAQALMAELGGQSPDEAAQALVAVLGPARAAALASALLANTPAS